MGTKCSWRIKGYKPVHSDQEIITCCWETSSCIVKVKTKPVLVE
jgi:hypothetical protein